MFNADVPEEDIQGAIQRLEEKYSAEEFAFQLFKSSGGYQFLTKPAYQASIGILLKQQSKKRLSTSAMETLSIIAYKQPVSKTELENIRGVNCDYAVQKLLDKGLIEITGKAETIGRPMLYGTTVKFMEYFGINDLTELPVPKEVNDTNTIGQNADTSPESDVNEQTAEATDENEIQNSTDSDVVTSTESDVVSSTENDVVNSVEDDAADSVEDNADNAQEEPLSGTQQPENGSAHNGSDASLEHGSDLTEPDAKA